MIKNDQKLLEYIQGEISKAIEPFNFEKNTNDTRLQIKSSLMNMMFKIINGLEGTNYSDVQLEVEPADEYHTVNIVPLNFFTALLTLGIYEPFVINLGANKVTLKDGPYLGWTFTWDEKEKKMYQKPPNKIYGEVKVNGTM